MLRAMLGPLDHALFVALVLLGPVWAASFGYRRLLRAAPDRMPAVRRSVYRGAMAIQWTLVAVLAALWIVGRRPPSGLGLVPHPTWGLAGVLLGSAIVIVMVWRQRTQVLRDDEALDGVREQLRHVEPMLPHDRRELRHFYGLSLTAGICEELLYRGFMIWYLTHFLALIPAAAVTSVVFGIGHSYQGPRGMALTGLVGAFFAAVYMISGTLYPAMLLHVLMDAHSGHLAQRALERAAERAAVARSDAESALELAAPAPDRVPREGPPVPALAESGDPESARSPRAAEEPA
jgi:uncharacterized protein